MQVFISHYTEILLCQQQKMNSILEAESPSTKSLNLSEYFSLFQTICFSTRADESLTKLCLKGLFSTSFKITNWMISQQSALNFLVFSGNKFNSFKVVCTPAPLSILLKFCKLSLSVNQSFFSILTCTSRGSHWILFVDSIQQSERNLF